MENKIGKKSNVSEVQSRVIINKKELKRSSYQRSRALEANVL